MKQTLRPAMEMKKVETMEILNFLCLEKELKRHVHTIYLVKFLCLLSAQAIVFKSMSWSRASGRFLLTAKAQWMKYCIYSNTSRSCYLFQSCWSAATNRGQFLLILKRYLIPLGDIDTIGSFLGLIFEINNREISNRTKPVCFCHVFASY